MAVSIHNSLIFEIQLDHYNITLEQLPSKGISLYRIFFKKIFFPK